MRVFWFSETKGLNWSSQSGCMDETDNSLICSMNQKLEPAAVPVSDLLGYLLEAFGIK